MTASPASSALVAVTAGAGLVVGVALARELAGARYRLDDEQHRPPPRAGWLVALAVPVVWALLTWRLGGLGGAALLPAYLLVGAVGVALAWVDLDVHRLPEGLTLPTIPIALGLLALGAWSVQRPGLLVAAVVGGLGSYAGYLGLALASRGALGLGDATLGGLVGIVLGPFGWERVLLAGVGAFVLAGVVALLGLAMGRLTLRSHLPFGPAILVSALLAVLG